MDSARFRLLAVDIDGTLLNTQKTITSRTRRALSAARALGTHVALVTGRRYVSAAAVARDLGGELTLLCHNGAMIVEDGDIVRLLPLSAPLAVRAIEVGKRERAEIVLHAGGEGQLFMEPDALAAGGHLGRYYDRSGTSLVPDLVPIAEREPTIQVMFAGDRAQIEQLRVALFAVLGEQVRLELTVYSGGTVAILEVLHPEVGKAAAVRFVQERRGITPEETLAIGDNWNDQEMIARAGLGLWMGNADPALRGLASPLPSNDQDGVAWALERFLLEGEAQKDRRG